MKSLRWMVLASVVGLAAGGVLAQPAGGKGPGAGPGPMGAGPAASSPGAGMGAGAGMGPGGQRGMARWGSEVTPGWSLMTPAERNEHRERMRSMKTYEECKAYQAEHHEQMAARAKERGGKPLPQPRRDGCAALKK